MSCVIWVVVLIVLKQNNVFKWKSYYVLLLKLLFVTVVYRNNH